MLGVKSLFTAPYSFIHCKGVEGGQGDRSVGHISSLCNHTCCVLSSALSLHISEIILVGTEAMQSTKARRRDLSENAM